MKILVINAGSSSLKYQLIDMETEHLLAKGLCERIGIDGHLKHTPLIGGKPVFDEDLPMPTHSEAIAAVIDKLTSAEYGVVTSMKEIDAVGHRVVHGGEKFACSVKIDDAVMTALEECTTFAPLHNPANITGINACRAVMGDDVPMVAVFDTAFHQTMPGKAYMYAIPYEYYRTTASAATASTARATVTCPPAAPSSWASPSKSSSSSPATWATAAPSARSTAASASTRPWASPRWSVCRWARAAAISTPA